MSSPEDRRRETLSQESILTVLLLLGYHPNFQYKMDSSHKDITVDCNPLRELVATLLPNCANLVDGAHFDRLWYQRHGSD